MKQDKLKIADKTFESRLMMGTGKFASHEIMKSALEGASCEIVTVALRRVDLEHPEEDILNYIDRDRYLLLPNTSGARTMEEAVRLARLAKSSGLSNWIKLEVIPDPRFLLPDPIDTLKATEVLVKEGFVVLPYINADPILAKRLEEAGAATVMPLAAPIGTNRGLTTKANIEIIIEEAKVPVVVDAGLGAPSHAAESMEMGASAVLVNTAIAIADRPAQMAEAFNLAVKAGHQGFLSGLGETKHEADASSPLTGFLN